MKPRDSGFRSRPRRTPQQRAELLAHYRRCGLSQRDFVQRFGLGLSSLTKWLREPRQTDVKPPEPIGAELFQEVKLNPHCGTTCWAAEVALADGAVRRLSLQADAAWAAELLHALCRPC